MVFIYTGKPLFLCVLRHNACECMSMGLTPQVGGGHFLLEEMLGGSEVGPLHLGRPYMSVLMFDSENLITMTS